MFLLLHHSTFCRFPLTVSALDSDRLQHGIIMCSMAYLAFDPKQTIGDIVAWMLLENSKRKENGPSQARLACHS